MHEENAEYRKIECTMCGWETLLDFSGVFEWLVKFGILKPNHDIGDDLVYELFHGMAERYQCPDCASPKLELSVVLDDFSDVEAQRCRGCEMVIPRERLEGVPGTKYCVFCQEKLDKGQPLPIQAEYCPVCGKKMELIRDHESRHGDFKWVCLSDPPCRYRKK